MKKVKIVLDENLPKYLKSVLQEYDVVTVQEKGWTGMKNGELISNIEDQFDIFITADKSMKYQQNLKDRNIAIIQLYTNRLPLIKEMELRIIKEVNSIGPKQFIEISP